jgi:hypothetical protein
MKTIFQDSSQHSWWIPSFLLSAIEPSEGENSTESKLIYPLLSPEKAEGEMQTVEAEAAIYPISWIFRSNNDDEVNLLTLIKGISDIEDEQVFGLPITQVLINGIFEEFAIPISKNVFVPFVLWIVLMHVYYIFFVGIDPLETGWDYLTLEFWLRNILILTSLYFGKFELFQLIGDGWEYFADIFNYFNVAVIVFNILICLSYGYNLNLFSAENIFLMMSFGIFFAYINCFYWMRFFEATSRYVRMIFSSIG